MRHLPKNISQWGGLLAPVLLAALQAYLSHGGSSPVVMGVPILAAIVSLLNLMQTAPKDTVKKNGSGGLPPAAGASTSFVALLVLSTSLGVMGVGTVSTQTGCNQIHVAFPQLDQVEQEVFADVSAGKSPEQIEIDVAKLLEPDGSNVAVDVVLAVNDALTFLIDMGFIPPHLIPQARVVQQVERAKLEAKAGAHAPAANAAPAAKEGGTP